MPGFMSDKGLQSWTYGSWGHQEERRSPQLLGLSEKDSGLDSWV
jgi:hypothetical protein